MLRNRLKLELPRVVKKQTKALKWFFHKSITAQMVLQLQAKISPQMVKFQDLLVMARRR